MLWAAVRHVESADTGGISSPNIPRAGRDTLRVNVIREDKQLEDTLPLSAEAPLPPARAANEMPELTPFMRQWTAAKRENPDALLFFRMGDFYELFYDDAVTVSRELQLTLTARDRERQQPMCGVPYHAVEGYLTRLLRQGYRIAICDQMEDPKLTKKIVRREVTRVLSPGTALDSALGQEQNNYLAALHEPAGGAVPVAAIALLDVSTGEFRTAEFEGPTARQQAVDEILKAQPSELLLASSAQVAPALERITTRTRIEDWVWLREFAVPLVERQSNVRSLEGFGLMNTRLRRLRRVWFCITFEPRRRTKHCILTLSSLKSIQPPWSLPGYRAQPGTG